VDAKRVTRDYPPIEVEEALRAVGTFEGDVSKAARAVNVPRRTLRGWWERLESLQQERYIKEARARQEAWWQVVHDECLQVAHEKIRDLGGRDALIGAGIAFDKLALIRGQATVIEGTIASDAESLAKAVEDVLAKVTVESTREVIDAKKGPALSD